MSLLPYDQRLARVLVRPFARRGISPNHLTVSTLLLALLASALFATGEPADMGWGAAIFMLARFMDHFDGELARQTRTSSRFGYYFDYVAGGVSYAALFAAIGIGLSDTPYGDLELAVGLAGAGVALVCVLLNLGLDREMGLGDGRSVGYPRFGGFELEDGIYLIGPVTWLGWLEPFFLLAGLGAGIYFVWTLWVLMRTRSARRV